jgi:hypothetical protein
MGIFDYVGGDSGWDWGSGISGTDFGSGWTDYSSGDGLDWTSMFGSDADFSGGSDSSSSASWITKLFGGGSGGSGGSSSGSGIFGALLSGLGGAADNYQKGLLDKESAKELGLQQRKTAGFQADLLDYYKQKDKVRKRTALDTYGQFSTMDKWAPNARPAAPIDMPVKPVAGT